ncbi:MAG TPA: helix-turn-helix domain-containing protein [Aeromicrobium sp.]|nr:helix-turn-helix domain-containing protein [Aeromicrobium sp.]
MRDRRRRVDAERNDERLVDATRMAIAELGTAVSVDAIAARAGVGVGTVYRRYASKEALLHRVCLDAVEVVRREADGAQGAFPDDPWSAVERFVRRCVDQRTGALASVAGAFVPADELIEAADLAHRRVAALISGAQRDGAVRTDVGVVDILRLIAVHSRGMDPHGGSDRALAISLDGLRVQGLPPLPGSPPVWRDERARWSSSEPS